MHKAIKSEEIKPIRQARFEVRVWDKTYTQAVLRACRNQGYEVKKEHGMYEVNMPDGDKELVMRAAPGARGYLVRHHPDLFEAA